MVPVGTGSQQGDTGCQCDMLSENIEEFDSLYGVNYQIIQHSEEEKVMTDKQMDKQNFLS